VPVTAPRGYGSGCPSESTRPPVSLAVSRGTGAPAPNGKPHPTTTGYSRSPVPIPLLAKGHRDATAYWGRDASAGRQKRSRQEATARELQASTAAAQKKISGIIFLPFGSVRFRCSLARLSFDRARSARQAPDRRSPGASGGPSDGAVRGGKERRGRRRHRTGRYACRPVRPRPRNWGLRCVRGGFAALLLPTQSLGFWISDATAWTRRVLLTVLLTWMLSQTRCGG
jgi:hypothetical protein